MSATADIMARLGLDKSEFSRGIKGAQDEATGLGELAGKVGPLLAGMFSVGAVTAYAKSIVDLGSQISDISGNLGVSTDSLQGLTNAAMLNGVGMTEVGRALAALKKKQDDLIEGNKEAAASFARLGLDAKAVAGMTVDELFAAVGHQASTATNELAAFSVVADLLGGKIGPKLVQTLKDVGSQGLQSVIDKAKEAGGVLSKDEVKQLDQAGDALDAFWLRVKVAGAGALVSATEGATWQARMLKLMLVDGNSPSVSIRQADLEEKDRADDANAADPNIAEQKAAQQAQLANNTHQMELAAAEKDGKAVAEIWDKYAKKKIEERSKAELKAAEDLDKAQRKYGDDLGKQAADEDANAAKRRKDAGDDIEKLRARTREQIRDVFTRGPRADDLSVGASLGSSLSGADSRRIGLARAATQAEANRSSSEALVRQLAADVAEIRRKLPQQGPTQK
jgi:hypothetical protein